MAPFTSLTRSFIVTIAAAVSVGSVTHPASLGEASIDPVSVRQRLDTRNRIALFAQDWNAFAARRSLRAWKRAARRHMVLVGPPGRTYGARISRLHSWNRRLMVMVYDLGPYTIAGTPLYESLLSKHPAYFARSAAGDLITVRASSGSPAFPRNTLMDPGKRGWRVAMAKRIAAAIRRYGFDGVYIDSMGLGPFTGTTTAVPMNRATGQPYTEMEWMRAEAKMVNRIRRAIGNRFIFSSGLVNGVVYRRHSRVLADSALDGIMTDSWMRLASAPVGSYPSVDLFRNNLRMARHLQAKGKYFFGWTKVWTAATDAQRRRWNRFALASYLLIKGRRALYAFTPSSNVDRTIVYGRIQLARLGPALNHFTVSDGIYRRRFEHGWVRVDPADHVATIRVTR